MINSQYAFSLNELVFTAIRSQGAGGQNVNKVSSAIHLRFDIKHCSLPEDVKVSILNKRHHLLTSDGVVVIKAQNARTQERNRQLAIERLTEVLVQLLHTEKPRKATRPTQASKKRRLEAKTRVSDKKGLRGKIRTL